MKQYLDLCQRIIDDGEWVYNERTGKKCLTVINANFTYDVENNQFPLVTTRKSFWKAAVAELLGYIRGYDNAADFRNIGCETWNANANDNEAWLKNPYRKGTDDMGAVYGVQGRRMRSAPSIEDYDNLIQLIDDGKTEDAKEYLTSLQSKTFDQLKKVYNNLKNGIDDRGEIITFWVPTDFEKGCLRPCMFQHHFSILGGKLYLNSYQRSCDVPLGLNFNMVQVYVFLALMAKITGLKPAKAYHTIVNAHIYEDQYDLMKNVQLKREPKETPQFFINEDIKTLEDVETWVTRDDFSVTGYNYHPSIKYPFSV